MKATRRTKQRQAVLDVLRATRSHPDAAWVFQEVRQVIPNVSLSTVYRALDALVQEGAITTIERAGERARYDFKHADHHHVVCRACGAIFDVTLSEPSPGLPMEQLPPGFQVTEVVLEFHGLCGPCGAGRDESILKS